MDPNAALETLRELAERLINESDAGQEPDETVVMRMCEVFQGLDDWIAKGGFLPSNWQR